MLWVQKNPLSLISFWYCYGLFYFQVKVEGAWWVAKLVPASHGTSLLWSLRQEDHLISSDHLSGLA